ncbi:PKD domain-containing protein [Raoultibacter phocaeensis]|uniref:PKD domain-containing protein n=1 Tax=Raoultibacter phocaeensis TaxID=2479841 RepID=UPI0011198CBF|nr:molybdopterin-binding protein [Raoultibacter phocaeensis]
MLGRVTGTVGEPLTFSGYADDFDKAIAAIEFSLDEGATWTRHDTPDATSDKLLTWSFVYTPTQPGLYRLRVRAVNEDGTRSPLADVVEFEVD